MVLNISGWPPGYVCDRPLWPPGVEIAAQAFDAFATWCVEHPSDCIIKQVEEWSDYHKFIRTYVEE